jgi:hypothetical protein
MDTQIVGFCLTSTFYAREKAYVSTFRDKLFNLACTNFCVIVEQLALQHSHSFFRHILTVRIYLPL